MTNENRLAHNKHPDISELIRISTIYALHEISTAHVVTVNESLKRGRSVIITINKKSYNQGSIGSTQDWVDLDTKLHCSVTYCKSMLQDKQLFASGYTDQPSGYLTIANNGKLLLVIDDGNHRAAVALYFDETIGIILHIPPSPTRVYSFQKIYNPIATVLLSLDK